MGGAAAAGIRVVAVAVVRDGDRVLVERGRDAVTGAEFLRAVGGGVAFGERAAAAAAREWREELALEITDLAPLGVLENLFTYEGRAGHEVVFVYAARLADGAPRGGAGRASLDPDGRPHVAVWASLAALRRGPVPLYPAGLLDLLQPPG